MYRIANVPYCIHYSFWSMWTWDVFSHWSSLCGWALPLGHTSWQKDCISPGLWQYSSLELSCHTTPTTTSLQAHKSPCSKLFELWLSWLVSCQCTSLPVFYMYIKCMWLLLVDLSPSSLALSLYPVSSLAWRPWWRCWDFTLHGATFTCTKLHLSTVSGMVLWKPVFLRRFNVDRNLSWLCWYAWAGSMQYYNSQVMH